MARKVIKMSTPLCSRLISRIYSLTRSTLPIRRQYCKPLSLIDLLFCFKKPSTEIFTHRTSFADGNQPSRKSLKDILDAIPPEPEALSPSDTLNILRSLSAVTGRLSHQLLHHVKHHQKFNILCEALTVSMPYLDTSDKFATLYAIKSLEVPVDSAIHNAILVSFHENLFNMSLNEIMLLDGMLFSSQRSQTVIELQRSLIDRFNLKCSKVKIEFNYYLKMHRMLQFIERNRYEIVDEVFDNMENCAAKQNVEILTAQEAMDTMILLSNFDNRSECVSPIFSKAFEVWYNSAEVRIEMVQVFLKILARRKRFSNTVDRYNDARLVGACARVAIANGDIDKCFSVLQYLNQLVSYTRLFNSRKIHLK